MTFGRVRWMLRSRAAAAVTNAIAMVSALAQPSRAEATVVDDTRTVSPPRRRQTSSLRLKADRGSQSGALTTIQRQAASAIPGFAKLGPLRCKPGELCRPTKTIIQ